ncbi:RluA family pseudouridine synthase [Tropicimonas sp. TH_r6]|uniref:RluA family pseudouridine synthase n=1 Tax=Tropicimonas sp. TH_r6 TaxID=3082085 RepID=UPI002953DF24|nr:RluA family pseudouridine synthase [Tropicimonas sp. TH_r6]MDV7145756.1 RluA family pseudouridine synthase [Tropicimonas sp. TH_r6]
MSPARLIRVEIAENPPGRLDKALARDVPEEAALSRSRLARLIADGQVSRGGEVVRDGKAKVATGDVIEITLPEAAEVETVAESIPLTIAYEDEALIVVDKPAGMVVHPAPGSPSGTLVNALLHHCGDTLSGIGGEKRPGIVHRIDKDTSGLLVVAKSDAAHHGLAAQFEAHSAERRYLALTHGCPDPADPRLRGIKGTHWETGELLRISTELARHKHDRQKQAVVWSGGRHAITRARVLEPLGVPPAAALVECRLETGRTHQIRVHMAHIGHGLLGDPVYGGKRRLSGRALGPDPAALAQSFPRQALHAASLGFSHPLSGKALSFESPLPEDMETLLTALRSGM